DPRSPAASLPRGTVEQRIAQQPHWIAMVIGFAIGLWLWFRGMALLPLLSGVAPLARWAWSALPLLTLPWWIEAFPHSVSRYSTDMAGVLGDMFADVGRMDRLVATDAAQATLAGGERIVWRLEASAYADTLGRFQ